MAVVFLEILLVTVLCLAWVVALAFALFDSISIGAKIFWVVALTLLAPIAIPVYFVLRRRRHRHDAEAPGAVAEPR